MGAQVGTLETSFSKLSGARDVDGMDLALNCNFRPRASLDFQVEEVLQVEPELRIGVEVTRQAQGGIGSDA
jgi:hypothetical protein